MTQRGVVVRRGGIPPAEAQRTWTVLDEAGCDTFYVLGDFALCGAIAARTSRARVCCLTGSADTRAAITAIETLRYVSGGRFTLGVRPLAAENGPFSSVMAAERLVEEAIDRVGPLPVIVAGDGDGPYRLAAELADGWLTTATPEQFTSRADQLRRWCRDLGRDRPLPSAVILPDSADKTDYETAGEIVTPLHPSLASAEEASAWLEAVAA